MLTQRQRSVIMVFAKAPVPGAVKTRLIPLLGEEKAAQLQAAMIVNTVEQAARHKCHELQLWCAPDTTHPLFLQLQRHYPLSLNVQQGEDLGMRMHWAFLRALRRYDAAVVIGTDCPGVTAELLDQSFQALYHGKDAVIAPAEDGGYVLLGLKKAAMAIFSGIDWGTDRVCNQTLKRFSQQSLAWETLETQWDVDRPEDLKRLLIQEPDFLGRNSF